ncbi:DNA-directed RNA polymerase RPB10 [Brazilian cedratvirus IHUMI]|uniref:DNA-directed RNA polymerase RPB10 n=1 Tax=Brazilian cedratvirus IHUMI TaxID=2126980 RepID=A0A2R8FDY0_9VIRU|nr:DNA-directed RNA polymerase RPB10 [Brazilian cedratvirus IHUMI]
MAERIGAVRCYTCGKVLNYGKYEKLTETMLPEKAFQQLGLRRYCCKMRLANPATQASREIYASREVAKNINPPPLNNFTSISSLNPY